jgi:hypothetical protein
MIFKIPFLNWYLMNHKGSLRLVRPRFNRPPFFFFRNSDWWGLNIPFTNRWYCTKGRRLTWLGPI